MSLTKTPFGEKVTSASDSFYIDTTGLIFRQGGKFTELPQVPVTESLLNTNKDLAKYLMNLSPRKSVLDIGSSSEALAQAFKELGVQAGHLNTIPVPHEGVQFDLITFVFSFERIPADQVISVVKALKKNLTDEGEIFIRACFGENNWKNSVHYGNIQCFWDIGAFLYLLGHVDGFVLSKVTPGTNGAYQDYHLRRVQKRPTMCAGIIAKNEERDLPICLKSLEGVVDGLCLIDTGSKDKTIEVAQKWAATNDLWFHSEVYTEASKQDEKGEWKLWNFSQARNRYIEVIEASGKFDYILWMDADDNLLTPELLRNAVYLEPPVIHAMQIQMGQSKWPHHRLIKAGKNIRYRGRCHEYPYWEGQDHQHKNIIINHDAAPHETTEDSNARNLRILKLEVEEEPTPRNCFYLGNTYKDGGKYAEAIPIYQKRLDFGKGYEDEYYFALLYKGRCEASANKSEDARKTFMQGALERPDWAEFWMDLAQLEYRKGQYDRAAGFALQAKDQPIAPTNLFREPNKYTDQPYRHIAWCYYHQKAYLLAQHYGRETLKIIGNKDESWNNFLKTIDSDLEKSGVSSPSTSVKKGDDENKVVWCRPGALGDIIMTLNLAKPFKKKNPGAHLVYQCHRGFAFLEGIIKQAGVDEVIFTDQKAEGKVTNLIGYPLKDGYPYKPMKKHLIEYFGEEVGLNLQEIKESPFVLPKPEPLTMDGRYATVHIKAGWSVYKNWGLDKWAEVIRKVREQFPVVQIGGSDDPELPGVYRSYLGRPFNESWAVLANSSLHLGIDSWTNHATNISWEGKGKVPGVILWGSTQHSAAGYKHNINLSAGLKCQPCFREDPKQSRMPIGVCPHPQGQSYDKPRHECMELITVDQVLEAIEKQWKS